MTWKEKIKGAYAEHKKKTAYKRAAEGQIRKKGQAAYYREKAAQTVKYQKQLVKEQMKRKLDAEKQRTKTAKKQGGQAQSLFTGTRSALVNFATKPHTGMGMGSSSSYSMASTMGSTDYKIPMMGSTTSRPKVTTRKKKKPRKRGITINL